MAIHLIKQRVQTMTGKQLKSVFALTALVAMAAPARAASLIDLYDWGFNLDGTTYLAPGSYSPPDLDQLPSTIDVRFFDFSDGQGTGGGLGTVTFTFDTTGPHYVAAFFDHEIDETVNSFTNESGAADGSLGTGQSWQISDPVAPNDNIIDNLIAGTLNNSSTTFGPNDIAMALGWSFTLAQDETATVSFVIDSTLPPAGFYLSQTDPDSDVTLYFRSILAVRQGPSIPEPATGLLLSMGLAGLLAGRRYLCWTP